MARSRRGAQVHRSSGRAGRDPRGLTTPSERRSRCRGVASVDQPKHRPQGDSRRRVDRRHGRKRLSLAGAGRSYRGQEPRARWAGRMQAGDRAIVRMAYEADPQWSARARAGRRPATSRPSASRAGAHLPARAAESRARRSGQRPAGFVRPGRPSSNEQRGQRQGFTDQCPLPSCRDGRSAGPVRCRAAPLPGPLSPAQRV